MPLTSKGSEILANMQEQYGPEKGEQVFYASRNAGTISGVDAMINPNFDPYAVPSTLTVKQVPGVNIKEEY